MDICERASLSRTMSRRRRDKRICVPLSHRHYTSLIFPKHASPMLGPLYIPCPPGGRFHGRIAHCFSRRRREPQRGFVGHCLRTTGKLVDSRTCFQPKLLSSISSSLPIPYRASARDSRADRRGRRKSAVRPKITGNNDKRPT